MHVLVLIDKVDTVQKLDEQEWKVKNTAGKKMSLLSMIGTMVLVVLLSFMLLSMPLL